MLISEQCTACSEADGFTLNLLCHVYFSMCVIHSGSLEAVVMDSFALWTQ